MINNTFKQMIIFNNNELDQLKTNIFPIIFQDEMRLQKQLPIIRPYKIIINTQGNLNNIWAYFNNDIRPVIINERFSWDAEKFGIFDNLYFVLPNDFSFNSNTDKIIITAFYREN